MYLCPKVTLTYCSFRQKKSHTSSHSLKGAQPAPPRANAPDKYLAFSHPPQQHSMAQKPDTLTNEPLLRQTYMVPGTKKMDYFVFKRCYMSKRRNVRYYLTFGFCQELFWLDGKGYANLAKLKKKVDKKEETLAKDGLFFVSEVLLKDGSEYWKRTVFERNNYIDDSTQHLRHWLMHSTEGQHYTLEQIAEHYPICLTSDELQQAMTNLNYTATQIAEKYRQLRKWLQGLGKADEEIVQKYPKCFT